MEKKTLLPENSRQSEKSVIIYRSEDGTIQLEVELYNETVWLTRPQMALLFNTTPQNVTMAYWEHIYGRRADGRGN